MSNKLEILSPLLKRLSPLVKKQGLKRESDESPADGISHSIENGEVSYANRRLLPFQPPPAVVASATAPLCH